MELDEVITEAVEELMVPMVVDEEVTEDVMVFDARELDPSVADREVVVITSVELVKEAEDEVCVLVDCWFVLVEVLEALDGAELEVCCEVVKLDPGLELPKVTEVVGGDVFDKEVLEEAVLESDDVVITVDSTEEVPLDIDVINFVLLDVVSPVGLLTDGVVV